MILSEYNEYGWGKVFESGKVFSANEAKSAILWNDPSIKGAFQDIYRLHKDNRDPSHTNLYYSLLRLWHIGFTSVDLAEIFYRGISLNFLFFIFGFYFAYRLARILLQRDWLILLFLSVAFLNPLSINNTIFMRPYALQEMLFLAFCLSLIFFINRLSLDYARYNNWRFYIIFGLITALLMSSAYFATIFVAMVFFCVSIWELKFYKQNKKFNLFFPLSFIVALVFCKILYPKYFQAFDSGRGKEVGEKINLTYLKESILDNAEIFFDILKINLSWVILVVIFIGLCLRLIYHKRLKYGKDALILLVGICAFIWAFAVIYLAPYKISRYILSIFPIFLLLLPYALGIENNIMRLYKIHPLARQFVMAGICVWCIFNILPFDKQKIDYIDHNPALYHSIKEFQDVTILINQDAEIEAWRYAYIIPALNSNIIFLHDCKELSSILPQYEQARLILFPGNEQCKINSANVVYHGMTIQQYKNNKQND